MANETVDVSRKLPDEKTKSGGDVEQFIPPGKTKAYIDRMPLTPRPKATQRASLPPLKYLG